MRALTLWPEWCPTFPGVRFADGTPSRLDKGVENRPTAPWSTIAPQQNPCAAFMSGPPPFLPGPWVAMHAGKSIGGGIGGERIARFRALDRVLECAQSAGWEIHWIGSNPPALNRYHGRRHEQPNDGPVVFDLDNVVTSAIVALFRITRVVGPGVGGPWRFVDRFGWYVEVAPLPVPIPCKGAQGLWTVPLGIVSDIATQLPEVAMASREGV